MSHIERTQNIHAFSKGLRKQGIKEEMKSKSLNVVTQHQNIYELYVSPLSWFVRKGTKCNSKDQLMLFKRREHAVSVKLLYGYRNAKGTIFFTAREERPWRPKPINVGKITAYDANHSVWKTPYECNNEQKRGYRE